MKCLPSKHKTIFFEKFKAVISGCFDVMRGFQLRLLVRVGKQEVISKYKYL